MDISSIEFPNSFLPNEVKKGRDYGLQYAKAMWSEWRAYNSSTQFSGNRLDRMRIAKTYRTGTQPTFKYIDQANLSGDQSINNLNLEPLPIIPKFVNMLVEKITSIEYDVLVKATDATSLHQKEELLSEITFKILNSDFYKKLADTLSVQSPEMPVKTIDELEIFKELNLKQTIEIALELAIQNVNQLNYYPELMRTVVDNIITYGIGGIRTELDPNYGVRKRVIDPERLIHSTIRTEDARDLKWAGESYKISIGELRRLYNANEDTLKAIAKKYAQKSNTNINFNQINHPVYGYGYYEYDSMMIDVFDFCFIDTLNLVKEKKINANDKGFRLKTRPDNYTLPEKSYKRELIKKGYEVVFSGVWIIDSDYIFNYGIMNNMLRKADDLSKTELPYKLYMPLSYMNNNRSLVEMIIPHNDQMQIAFLKIQQMIAKARPKGLILNIAGMSSVDMGKGETSPLELVKIYNQSGNLIWQGVDEEGKPVPLPMQEIANGLDLNTLKGLIDVYNFNLNQVRGISGLNELADASTPNPDTLVGVQKLAVSSANVAAGYLLKALKSIVVRDANTTVLALQDLVQYGKLEAYKGIFGSMTIETIKAIKNIHKHQFSCFIELSPTEEEKMLFEQNASTSLGLKEITLQDIQRARTIKNQKLAYKFLDVRRKAKIQEDMEKANNNTRTQAEAQSQAAIAIEQNKLQTDVSREQLLMKKIEMETQSKAYLLQLEYQLKGGIANTDGQFKLEAEKIRTGGQVQKDEMKEDRKDERDKMAKEMESQLIEQRKGNAPPQKFTEEDDVFKIEDLFE